MILFKKFVYSPSRLLCIKYYRAASDGWKDDGNCERYILQYQQLLRHLTGSHCPNISRCNICIQQPPSLRDTASHILLQYIYGIFHQFELTAHTTYDQYVRAVRSGRVDEERLLPSEYSQISPWFCFNRFQ